MSFEVVDLVIIIIIIVSAYYYCHKTSDHVNDMTINLLDTAYSVLVISCPFSHFQTIFETRVL